MLATLSDGQEGAGSVGELAASKDANPSDPKTKQQRKTAKENWQALQKKLLTQVRMRRMAEYFIKIPSLQEKYIEPTFVETNCPRL